MKHSSFNNREGDKLQTTVFFEVPLANVPLEMHDVDLAVIRCIDPRFRLSDQHAIEEGLKVPYFDLFGFPAPAKLLSADSETRDAFLNAIRTVCVGLHHVKRVLILGHWDCGGYGGSKAFSSSDEEEKVYQKDLAAAGKYLQAWFTDVQILVGYSKVNRETGMLIYQTID